MSVRNVRPRVGSVVSRVPCAKQAIILAPTTALQMTLHVESIFLMAGAIQSATYVKRRTTAMIVFGTTAVLIQPVSLGVTLKLIVVAFQGSIGRTGNAKSVGKTISVSTGSSWRVRTIV